MLSEALRLIRVFHDMKQKELAEKLDISNSHLCEIESGKKKPTIELINRYSEEFGMPSSSILFFGESLEEKPEEHDPNDNAREAISRKVLNFLQLVESRTSSE